MVKREPAIDDYPNEQRDADAALDRYWESLQSHSGAAPRAGDDLPPELRDDFQLLRDLHDARQIVREDSLGGDDISLSAIAPLPAVGSTVGEYELLAPVGTGGMGVVYRARHQRLGKTVALKLMGRRCAACETTRQRFEREMQACGRLEHANIVRATDAGEYHGQLYLVMEYVDGIDLSAKIRRDGPLQFAEACRIARDAARALEYVHQHELVHRDVKPSNLMLTNSGEVKLLDLGLAQFSLADGDVALTATEQLVGTVDYMAPECTQTDALVDHRADIFALGATLYKLLTGRAPHQVAGASSLVQKLQRLTSSSAPSIAGQVEGLPPALVGLVDKMLAKDPQQRVQTARKVADALAGIVDAQPVQDRASDDTVQRQREATRDVPKPIAPDAQADDQERGRNRWVVLTATVLGLLAASLAIYLTTNKGTIVIESPHDEVEVRVKKGERVVEQLKVNKGETSTTVFAGEYEIEILGPVPERYDVDRQRIQLRRGEDILVTITEKPAEVELAAIPMAPDNPWNELLDDFERHQQAANWLDEVGARLWITRDGELLEQYRSRRDADQLGYRIVKFNFPVGESSRSADNIAAFRSGLAQWKGLSSIQTVDIGLPDLSDAEVVMLASLPDLNSLILSDQTFDNDETCHITSDGMSALARHDKLTFLSLAHLPLDDALIAPLSEAKQLQRLNLRGTLVGDEGMKTVAKIRTLKQLDLTRTSVGAAGLAHLTTLTNLQSLDVEGTHIPNAGLSLLTRFPKLRELHLSSRTLSDTAIPHVAHLDNLERLSLSAPHGGRLTDTGLEQLGQLRELRFVAIHSIHVDGSFLKALGGLTELEELDLFNCPIEDDALAHLKQFPKLNRIDLRHTAVTDDGLRRLRNDSKIEFIQTDKD